MSRIEFPQATKGLIAARSGYRCSIPSCNRLTVGPGAGAHEVSTSGVAAHIFSASEGGPRGRGGLTEHELSQTENGIWVCAIHSRLIDSNSGVRYPAPILLSFKQLQEARTAKAHEGLPVPVYWLYELILEQSPMFLPFQKISLAKVNLLIGHNETGKTAICEWLSAFSNLDELQRWRHGNPKHYPINLELRYFDPEPHSLSVSIQHDAGLSYKIDGAVVPLSPVPMKVVFLRQLQYVDRPSLDEIQLLSELFSVDEAVIRNLVPEINRCPESSVRNIKFETNEKGTFLIADVQGTKPGLPFRRLSGSEQKRIVIEFGIALCQVLATHQATLLILDTVLVGLDPHWFERYARRLADPTHSFQTLAVIPTRVLDVSQLHWWGWQIIRTVGDWKALSIDQSVREITD